MGEIRRSLTGLVRCARFAPLLLGVGLAGCIPFPHCVRTASELSGQVTGDGQPLVRIRVKRPLSHNPMDERCDRDGDEAVTDSAGRFSFLRERSSLLAS